MILKAPKKIPERVQIAKVNQEDKIKTRVYFMSLKGILDNDEERYHRAKYI